jgi:hypothetical protein
MPAFINTIIEYNNYINQIDLFEQLQTELTEEFIEILSENALHTFKEFIHITTTQNRQVITRFKKCNNLINPFTKKILTDIQCIEKLMFLMLLTTLNLIDITYYFKVNNNRLVSFKNNKCKTELYNKVKNYKFDNYCIVSNN